MILQDGDAFNKKGFLISPDLQPPVADLRRAGWMLLSL
ncbi:hypothetical protein XACS584_1500002 [Xanthomonas citri pv. citri]|nr:hypothetical protein XAC2911_1710002 [Xanthomonas citri pv. citri]CEE56380.1 hypothetical protein XACS584_1500002 [Xanthomonas citri pv. citri]